MTAPLDAGNSSSRRVLILYGSQTGTAHDYAQQIAAAAARHHLTAAVVAMDDYNKQQLLSERIVIFVCSTTGQGECPDNMKQFYKFILRKDLLSAAAAAPLQRMIHATLGLGDSSYPLFNAIARRLHQRITDLGSTPLLQQQQQQQQLQRSGAALGDDQAALGVDSAFVPWCDAVMQQLLLLLPLPQGCTVVSKDALLPSKFACTITAASAAAAAAAATSPPPVHISDVSYKAFGSGSSCCFSPVACALRVNTRITHQQHTQDVRHIEFDISNHNNNSSSSSGSSYFSYSPGDVVFVWPQNDAVAVAAFITNTLHRNPTDIIHIRVAAAAASAASAASQQHELPDSCTLQELFQCHLDIHSSPKRHFCAVLSHFSQLESHQRKLQEFAETSAEAQTEYLRYVVKERRNYMELLSDFDSVFPLLPLEYLLEFVPRLQPRAFSISSSQVYQQQQQQQQQQPCEERLHITMALLKYTTPFKRSKVGVLSRYLEQLTVSNDSSDISNKLGSHCYSNSNSDSSNSSNSSNTIYIPLYVRHTRGFRLPSDTSVPVVMIGPGTGIAPFRAMCWERYALMQQQQQQTAAIATTATAATIKSTSNLHVFFGCRRHDADLLYAAEWQQLLQSNTIASFTVACSRDVLTLQQQQTLCDPGQTVYDHRSNSNSNNSVAELPVHTSTNRIYVQQQLLAQAPLIYSTLFSDSESDKDSSKRSMVMVAGSSGAMPRDINNTLIDIVAQHITASAAVEIAAAAADTAAIRDQATATVKALQQQRRYVVETWG